MTITKGREIKALLLLLVPLLEELLHAPGQLGDHQEGDSPGGPLVVEVPLLGRVGDVAGVKKQAQDQCLVKTGEFALRLLT